MNEALRHGTTIRAYVYSFVSTDSYNNTARRLMSELEPLLVRIEQAQVRFSGWLGAVALDVGLFDAALAEPGIVHEHDFFLRETAEQSQYLMNADEEALAADLSLSGIRASAV